MAFPCDWIFLSYEVTRSRVMCNNSGENDLFSLNCLPPPCSTQLSVRPTFRRSARASTHSGGQRALESLRRHPCFCATTLSDVVEDLHPKVNDSTNAARLTSHVCRLPPPGAPPDKPIECVRLPIRLCAIMPRAPLGSRARPGSLRRQRGPGPVPSPAARAPSPATACPSR